MANTRDFERPPAGETTVGRGIVVEVDRTRSHRVAKRHSKNVRVLKVALPLVSLSILIAYGLAMIDVSRLEEHLPKINVTDILPENLTMDNPSYEGFGKDGSSYNVHAKTAQQDLKNTSLVKLNEITAELTETDKSKTVLVAGRGLFNHTANVLELENGIDIKAQSGLKAKLSRATLLAKEGLVTSKEPVLVEFPGGAVTANTMTMRHKAKEVAFAENVKARLQPPAKPAAADAAPAKPAATQASPFTASDAPVDITAQRLDIADEKKIAVFAGDVVAVQADAALSTPELTVHYAAGDTAQPGAQQSSASAMGAGKVSKIVAKGPVAMTRGTTDRVTSDAAVFDTAASSATLTGNVLMTSGADRKAVSNQAELNSAADTALLTGGVVVNSGTNELKGSRLWVDRKAQVMQLTNPGGRISARFSQAGAAKGKSAQTQGAGAVAPPGFATFRTDPNAPVDIEADRLDANDAAKVATFSGNVKAVQAGFTIKTAELRATYSGQSGLGDMPGGGGTQKGEKAQTQLTKIEARKKVVVASDDGQTVHGDWAVFDTAAKTVTVGGDVMLSQGKNVVRGTRLVVDMTTGQSTIATTPDGTTAQPAGGGWVTNKPAGPAGTPNQGRPSAVFYPDQLKAMRDGGKEDAPSAPKDAWKASTTPQAKSQSGN